MAKLLYYQKNNSVYFAIDDGVNPVDYTVGTYPPNSISIKIDTDGETLTFSHNPPSGQPREIIKRRFDEIADENGTVYSAVDAPAALLAINLAVGQFATTGGGGGGGGATELTQLDIKNNTAPRILTAGYWELSQLGQSTVTLSGVRYIKIERAEQHGTAGTDQVTVTDVQGVVTELFQGDVVEFPQIFNYTYGDVIVQASNSSTIVKITYIE